MNHPFFPHFKAAREKPYDSPEYERTFKNVQAYDDHLANCPTEALNRAHRESLREQARAARPLNRILRAIQSIGRR